MMNPLFAMRCKLTTRRLQRYLDMDPDALLSEKELAQVRSHLVECERCTKSVDDYRRMNSALRRFGDAQQPDDLSVARLKAVLGDLNPRDL